MGVMGVKGSRGTGSVGLGQCVISGVCQSGIRDERSDARIYTFSTTNHQSQARLDQAISVLAESPTGHNLLRSASMQSSFVPIRQSDARNIFFNRDGDKRQLIQAQSPGGGKFLYVGWDAHGDHTNAATFVAKRFDNDLVVNKVDAVVAAYRLGTAGLMVVSWGDDKPTTPVVESLAIGKYTVTVVHTRDPGQSLSPDDPAVSPLAPDAEILERLSAIKTSATETVLDAHTLRKVKKSLAKAKGKKREAWWFQMHDEQHGTTTLRWINGELVDCTPNGVQKVSMTSQEETLANHPEADIVTPRGACL